MFPSKSESVSRKSRNSSRKSNKSDRSEKSARSNKSDRSLPSLPDIAMSASDNRSKGSKGSQATDEESVAPPPSGALPGEDESGRMGADIQALITDITDHRNHLMKQTEEDQENLRNIENEIELLEYRQMKIESRLQKRNVAKKEYEKTLDGTEKAFNKIVQTANSVANILKPPSDGAAKVPIPDDLPAASQRSM
jgi:Sjoegren syndrome nuclear autoantigen 1